MRKGQIKQLVEINRVGRTVPLTPIYEDSPEGAIY